MRLLWHHKATSKNLTNQKEKKNHNPQPKGYFILRQTLCAWKFLHGAHLRLVIEILTPCIS